METYVFLFAVILLSSALQTGTGFGFSIVTVPFLLFAFDARDAVQINILLSLLLSLLMFAKVRKDIDRGLLKRLLTGSLVFMTPGLLVFLYMPFGRLKLIVSLFILLFTVLLAFRFRMTQTPAKDRAVGGLSGFLSAAVGIPGPPLLAYFSAVDLDKDVSRSTTLAFYIFIYGVSAALQLLFAPTSGEAWLSAGASVPFVLLGMWIGQRLFRYVNQRSFQRICIVILFFTGIQLLYSSI
ncbi:sulfite exporter TauE/SafE family protein [Paenibacillus antri]|uniref:Probable membrane transporter protein n=1 Tax=Paenibacillus antri TaxID=2582848 RepID=A0A5R9G8Q4_9BACL|nr:sulfite exporter TauE/SafE family protein [Paenibacillus antri]TLS49123.1 sulfite exporter TauE/SafE family protein [Paenibacillus antri]